MDVYTKDKRSEIMKSVKSNKNKSTELELIDLFKKHHITGWRRNYPVKGHPDFVFLDQKIAIFVDGCFWHGHSCRKNSPQQNHDFWEKKISYNKKHDTEVTELFQKRGWTVIRIWECELRKKNQEITIQRLMKELRQ